MGRGICPRSEKLAWRGWEPCNAHTLYTEGFRREEDCTVARASAAAATYNVEVRECPCLFSGSVRRAQLEACRATVLRTLRSIARECCCTLVHVNGDRDVINKHANVQCKCMQILATEAAQWLAK